MNQPEENFVLQWFGEVIVVVPAANVESMKWDLIEDSAREILRPIDEVQAPMLIFDLTGINYFGSVFLSLLLQCHKFVRSRGGELVICGASDMAVELLRVTALDTLWAMYDTREDALEALQ